MQSSPAPSVPLPTIPADGLLLHIGVFKTGTTALQEAMRAAEPALAEAGVLFRGPASWKWEGLLGLMREKTSDGPWQELEESVHSHPDRVMVSSENLCGASASEAKTVVSRLGRDRRVTVLITVRSVSGLLASTWQQLLKRGIARPYDAWLHDVLDHPGSTEQSFWRRNDFPAQLSRWGALVGEENVVIAVSDKAHPTRNIEIVEDMLTVPRGSVQLTPNVRSNRSMSFGEAELLRRVNEEIRGDLSRETYRRLVRLGVFPSMFGSGTGADSPIPLPRWAAESAAAIGAQQAAVLSESQAVVVGDISALGAGKWDIEGDVVPPPTVPMDMAVAAVTGALRAAQREEVRRKRGFPETSRRAQRTPTRRLRKILKRT